jgi:DNA-binding response OmpR family regulator
MTFRLVNRTITAGGVMGSVSMVNPNRVSPYNDEHLYLDFDQQSAALDGRRMQLTRKEYDLFALLVQHAGQIIPRDALLMQVWGYGTDIRTRTLDVHVRRLRKKLGQYADEYIETIFGIGYRFQPFHTARYFRGPIAKPAVAMSV